MPAKQKIKLTLDATGQTYSAKADTFEEATMTIYKDSLGKIKTWGVFTLEVGGKKAEIEWRPIQIKRALNPYGKFARELLEKKLLTILK